MDEAIVILRDFNQDLDQAYIYASWRNNSYYSAEKRPEGKASDFFTKQSRKIKTILQIAKIKIACFKDTPNVIVGYSVAIKNHLCFIFVKPDYRLRGIGALLMPKDIQTVTDELTKVGKILVDKKNLVTQGEFNGHTNQSKDRQTDQRI